MAHLSVLSQEYVGHLYHKLWLVHLYAAKFFLKSIEKFRCSTHNFCVDHVDHSILGQLKSPTNNNFLLFKQTVFIK